MKKQVCFIFLNLIILSALLTQCSQINSHNDFNRIDDNCYYNEFLKISFPLNDDWSLIKGEKKREILGEKLIVYSGKESTKDNIILLNMIHKEDSSSIFLGTEKISGVFGLPVSLEKHSIMIKSVLDYLPRDYHYIDHPEIRIINNKEWRVLKTFYIKKEKIYQDYYTFRKGRYFIVLISTYKTKKQQKKNQELITNCKIH